MFLENRISRNKEGIKDKNKAKKIMEVY